MKQSLKKGLKNKVGAIGESIAALYLQNEKGLTIIETNFLERWGEIDIVAHETNNYHFIEVKTVSYETKDILEWSISHETWRPEENVHKGKLLKLCRTIETWIAKNNYTGSWQIDIVIVRLVPRENYACVNVIENVIV